MSDRQRLRNALAAVERLEREKLDLTDAIAEAMDEARPYVMGEPPPGPENPTTILARAYSILATALGDAAEPTR